MSRSMLIELMLLAALAGGADDRADAKTTVRDSVCAQRSPVVAGDDFGIMVLPGPSGINEYGVVMLVNCSDRKIVSLRDPSRSRRHVNEFPYDPRYRGRIRGDANGYEILNFNARSNNSVGDHVLHSRRTWWTGPCAYAGLELTTATRDDQDPRTIMFDLDICKSQIVALLKPRVSPADGAP